MIPCQLPPDGPRVGIVVPTWNRGATAVRALGALGAGDRDDCFVVVVDSGSRPEERAILERELPAARATLVALPENRGFAGAVNAGLEEAFAREADVVLVLNDDATVDMSSVALLGEIATAADVGIVAPRVVDADSGREVSRGERVHVPLLCLPRTWLRVRRGDAAPYAVSGVLGVAFVVTRVCWERVGPLAEPFFAYYEEVDYCLRVRAAGFRIVVAPQATVRHEGFRGFAAGFTPLAAYLKARNLPLVVRRHGGLLDWAIFLPTYFALLTTSAVGYLARGSYGVLRAMLRGTADGVRARSGPPPAAVAGPT